LSTYELIQIFAPIFLFYTISNYTFTRASVHANC